MLILLILAVLALLAVLIYLGNNSISVTHIEFSSSRLPAAFDGCRIAHISDLHSKRFGREQRRLARRVEAEKPDGIAVTGDIIRRSDRDFSNAVCCIRQLASIAPVWFIPGNHEADLANYKELTEKIQAAGATVLENRWIPLSKEEQTLFLAGIADPVSCHREAGLTREQAGRLRAEQTAALLAALDMPTDGFHLLLAHRPELFQIYLAAGMDLTLTGHAHGGQVRLPFLGGLFSPGQGWLPPYTSGLYRQGAQGMAVSRGLGGKRLIPRIFNRPHIPVICLRRHENS